MQRLLNLFLIIASFMCISFATDVPKIINYQGKLFDGGGPANGSYNIAYELYTVSSGGTPVWQQSAHSVTVTNGLFSDTLGRRIDTTLIAHQTLWLQVIVNGTSLSTRERLWSAPYALTVADSSISQDKIIWGEGTDSISAADIPYAPANLSDWGGSDPGEVDDALDDIASRVNTLESGTSNYVKLSPTSVQTDADATSSIWINKTAASGNLIQLQQGGTDEFVIDYSGNANIAGNLEVDGNNISGTSTGDGQFVISNTGNIRMRIDSDDDGSSQFEVRGTSGNALIVTEGGNLTASGNGTFSGNLTLSGDDRVISTGDNLDIQSNSELDLYIDYNDDGTGSAFYVKTKSGGSDVNLFRVDEDGDATVYRKLKLTPQTSSLTGTSGDLYYKQVSGTDTIYANIDGTWRALATTNMIEGSYIENQYSSAQSGAGFWTAGNGRIGSNLYVDGNAGIGTTGPADKLQVEDGEIVIVPDAFGGTSRRSSDDNDAITMVGTTSDYVISVQDGTGRVQHYWNANPSSETYLVSGEAAGKILFSPASNPWIEFDYAGSGTAGNSISWNKQVVINTSGNVGIGTPSPQAELDVNGTIRANHYRDNGGGNLIRSNDGSITVTEDADGSWNLIVAGGSSSGNFGINVETLTADKTLQVGTDEMYQYLDPNGANRNITLSTSGASAGDRFIIRNNGSYNSDDALITYQGGNQLDWIYAGGIKEFIFDGTNWVSASNGTGENDDKKYSVSLGYGTKAYTHGTAIGYSTQGFSYGTGIGEYADGHNHGVAVGRYADADAYGVAVGDHADGHSSGVAIGYYTGDGITSGSGNILIGYQAGDNITTGSKNILVGYNIDTPDATTNNFLSIGNLIFATGIDGEGTTVSSGKVGIGTPDPSYKLEVAGDAGFDDYLYHNDDDNTYIYFTPDRIQFYTGGRSMIDVQYSDNEVAINEGGTQTDFRVEGGTDDHLLFTDGSTDRVGIGTPSPSTKLHVNGDARVTGRYYDSSNNSGSSGQVLSSTGSGTQWTYELPGQRNSATISSTGWYRIASNSGNRADATFTLRDQISGGGHSTVRFEAGVNFGDAGGISFTLLNHSRYSTATFTQVRIIENGTYDGAYLEVYCARTGNVEYTITDNEQASGWTPVDWTAGSIPSGWTAHTYNIDKLFVIADSDDRVTVNRGGNVGIGAPSPSARLDVVGNAEINGQLDMQSNRIVDLADPTNAQDAATKNYVDTHSGSNIWQDAGAYVYPNTATSFHIEDDGDLDLGGHDIERVDEISANNIDPVLKIGGKLYRTWTLDMVGQRVEVVGQAKLNSKGFWEIDLATQPEASDFWLFWHSADQKTIIPFVSPQGPANLYGYMEGSKFIVKSMGGENNIKFSYRLIAVRYDFRDKTQEETNIRTKPTDTYIDIDGGQRYDK